MKSGADGSRSDGFRTKAVAAGERHREHPHRHHAGEIERRDPGDDPERLPERVAVDVGTDVLRDIPFQQVRDAHRKLDHLEPARHLAERVVVRLAMLAPDQPGDLVGVLPAAGT